MHIDRDLSLLAFQARVLEQARDEQIPLLERLKFLCISSNNLDEFFEIRVASLKQKLHASVLNPEILDGISRAAHQLVQEQYQVLNDILRPALAQAGIRLLRRSDWTLKHTEWVKKYFEAELLPVLSPIGLDPAHPFPKVLNKSLNFMVSLEGRDAFGRQVEMAVVSAPRSLPRIVRVPKECSEMEYDFISLASMIRTHMDVLFPDMQVTRSCQFRVTRNSNLFVDEEEIDDLLETLEGELPSRRYGDAVRLEIEEGQFDDFKKFLRNHFELNPNDIYEVDGPVNLTRLMAIYDLIDKPELKYPSFTPFYRQISFETIEKNDLLLLHPFESFTPVMDWIRQAARDPKVLAIKQTLYRTGADSVIIDYLVEAAQQGKEVTVVIELMARFDEEANITLANRLQEAGVHVVYGIVGYKTHAKMLLIVRREADVLKRYVHLGTGNYHPKTTKQYTDYSFLSCDTQLGEDIQAIFMELTGFSKVGEFHKCLQAPFTLRTTLLNKIQREKRHVLEGKTGHIQAKLNGLSDHEIIQALCEAAEEGVRVDLIVRGICSLKPHRNIRIRSVLGRFLEHNRVYYFLNQGAEEVYLSSADWMHRNLSRRIEIAFPIEEPQLKKRIIHEAFELYWQDNAQSFDLYEQGQYFRAPMEGERISAQEKLLFELALDRKER